MKAIINGTEIYYEVIGSGTPLLMTHGGLGLDHTAFRPWFDQLSDQFQVIYYDHRGNGRSSREIDYAELTLDQLVDDAAALLDHLGIQSTALFGHSYGGFIAQLFAIKYPERVSRLILANTTPAFDYQPAPQGTDEQLAAFGAAFTRPMESDEDWRTIWGTLCQMYFKAYDAEIGRAMDAGTHYSADGWHAGLAALATYNTLEKLPTLQTRTLAICGDHDVVCPTGPGGGRIHSLMPNAKLVVFADSAHYPYIEEEAAFFDTVRQWLLE